jgi:DNA-binding MarR family transcriptional regulator
MGQLERIRAMEDALRVRIMTCEAEILLFLKDGEGRKLQDLCTISKYSHVTIHEYLRKMTAANIISKEIFDGDGRRVNYTLKAGADKVLGELCCKIGDLI